MNEIIGIDWGTTHRRAYRVRDGRLAETQADDQGLLASRGRFPQALAEMLARFTDVAADVPVLMSGMVGSAQGWHELPYLPLPLALNELGRHLFEVPDGPPGRRCAMVPGCASGIDPWVADAPVDVMRGEETQLLGAVALGHADGWLVLPGTHSKWVRLQDGRIEAFSTFMTGELFALLSTHGTLAPLMQVPADPPAPPSAAADAFAAGVHAAQGRGLSNALFGCRARVVTGRMPKAVAGDYLSGVLIGAEFDAARSGPGLVPERLRLIGSPALAERYVQAGKVLGVALERIDPQAAYVAAVSVLAASL